MHFFRPKPRAPSGQVFHDIHKKCNNKRCTFVNSPQAVEGKYICAHCRKGTYRIDADTAEASSVYILAQDRKAIAYNKRLAERLQQQAATERVLERERASSTTPDRERAISTPDRQRERERERDAPPFSSYTSYSSTSLPMKDALPTPTPTPTPTANPTPRAASSAPSKSSRRTHAAPQPSSYTYTYTPPVPRLPPLSDLQIYHVVHKSASHATVGPEQDFCHTPPREPGVGALRPRRAPGPGVQGMQNQHSTASHTHTASKGYTQQQYHARMQTQTQTQHQYPQRTQQQQQHNHASPSTYSTHRANRDLTVPTMHAHGYF